MYNSKNCLHVVSKLIVFGLVSLLTSCERNYTSPPNNNELKATVTFSSGMQHFLYARGTTAAMECDILRVSSFVSGSDGTGTISFSLHDGCVTTPKTFDSLVFQYNRAHRDSDSSQVYSNRNLPSARANIKQTAFVTLTVVNDLYWEGTFNAVCWRTQGDSAIVVGTFKGIKRK